MRLWHKDLIPVLPKQQLLGQWRECCAIARNIAVNGTPNHLLVNKIMDYPIEHFFTYGYAIFQEMYRREYHANFGKFAKYFPISKMNEENCVNPFPDWHNGHYLLQCYYNLQEKHDCGGIPDDEWNRLHEYVMKKGCKA